MQKLKPQILAVLTDLEATPEEIAALTSYFSDQLANAQSSVDGIQSGIESLQLQLVEENARTDAIRAAVGKFVVAE